MIRKSSVSLTFVIFRESALLWNTIASSSSNKERVLSIIAHEFAHMWFGNLVTCDWWDYTFLNEGFARYFQYFSLAKVKWFKCYCAGTLLLHFGDWMYLAFCYVLCSKIFYVSTVKCWWDHTYYEIIIFPNNYLYQFDISRFHFFHICICEYLLYC